MADDDAARERARKHDETYKQVFRHPELIRELLEHFVDPALVQDLDLSKIELVNSAFINSLGDARDGDKIWRLRYGDGATIYLYLMVEFQSQVDFEMTLRVGGYVNLLQISLVDGDRGLLGALPPVLPIVLYNGKHPWSAATHMSQQHSLDPSSPLYVYQPQIGYYPIDIGRLPPEAFEVVDSVLGLMFQVERASPDQVQEVLARLVALSQREYELRLWGDVLMWLTEALRARKLVPSAAQIYSFTEVEAMLGETFDEWAVKEGQRLRQEERLGTLRAMLQKHLRLKFGEDATREARIEAMDEATLELSLERILSADDEAAVFGSSR